ncbi:MULTISPECIES: lysoplasmalogenase [unclassified Vibrio]|uniref:Lysoplasmalogenase n=1 Tax=Vibrio sp. HB236076 TaxID=3232307 RepID=A0AB39HFR8_9VIBR|nr:lysoplasmalogenase [Vibrio sp. HB161653]MDP5255725.1 lysoplasmalogenase [Vibrio sp. HB161653]
MWSWLAIGLCALMSVISTKQSHLLQAQVFKSFTFVLLAILVSTQVITPVGSQWLCVGLIISMVTDWSLVSAKRLPLSFLGFVLAQVAYSLMFWSQMTQEVAWWPLAVLLAAGVVGFLLLLPKIDRLVFPVVIMGIVLIHLAWIAGEWWLQLPTFGNTLAIIAVLLLLFSSMAYLLNRHHKSVPSRYLWVMGGYLLAQILLTASLIYR